MTPSSSSLSASSLYAQCLTGGSYSFPLSWMCGLVRSVTKLCRAIECSNNGLSPIAVFDIRRDQVSCHATIRLRASTLAIRFLTIFLKDFRDWNCSACYPKEVVGKTTSYSGVARLLPHSTSKNMCSAILPLILKLSGVKTGALETRFWWTRVDFVEKLIFISTLAIIREQNMESPSAWGGCVLTTLYQEESRVTHSHTELIKLSRWNTRHTFAGLCQSMAAQPTSITDCKTHTVKDAVATSPGVTDQTMSDVSWHASSQSSSSRSSPYSTRSHSPVSPMAARPQAPPRIPTETGPLSDHLKLRTCNFPPRKRVVHDSVFAKWDGRVPCLSGIVFGPFIEGGFQRHQAPCTPRGLSVNASAKGFLSIW